MNESLTLTKEILNARTPCLPFTYLTVEVGGSETVTGYTTGVTSVTQLEGLEHVDLTIVYVNDPSTEPERTQTLPDGTILPRKKKIIKGTNFNEWQNEHDNLLRYLKICQKTGTPKLFVPTESIVSVHEPVRTMQEILAGNNAYYNNNTYRDNLIAVNAFLSSYFLKSDLGIYGSGLVGITSRNPKDIDMLVVGLENLEMVKHLASEFPTPVTNPNKFGDPYLDRAKASRDKASKILIPDTDGVYCDVKVVPRNGVGPITNSLMDWQSNEIGTNNWSGVVIDDSETLSCPGGIIITDDNQLQHRVINTSYEYCGAAVLGDTVKIRGSEHLMNDAQRIILVTNTYSGEDKHFMIAK